MTLWSAALFGHYKPKEYGWERRAEPGDIIAVRPISEHSRWTDTERREFLIVMLDDFERDHLGGLTEAQWDTDSYPVVPDDAIADLIKKGERMELYPGQHLKKRRFQITLDDLRDRGVAIDKMLDKNLHYNPEIEPIKKITCHDKLKTRYALASDGFKPIKPIIVGKVF